MDSARPLRELLTDLVGDAGARAGGPEAYLAEHGHDLPPDLVAEAVVSFADTAPPEVAEHLAPFVTAHTAGEEPADWFDLLTSAPVDPADDLDDLDDAPLGDVDADPDLSLDFGAGAFDDDPSVDHVPTHVSDDAPGADSDADDDAPDWSAPDDTEPPEPSPDVLTDDDGDDSDDDLFD
ncbi:hypothetical protein [Actinophytocola oryzae]|uniref:Uncharacterized protein n=1 Tax=Actinophytocola oryzae TaxID=502181 RepID=A0A4R7W5P8_9PSEU|nr:hypothetical protein [Actinophytocola oryzae]TDV57309.1 hypothetical protein CLV71_101180 [Actinophytocola oryzae]